MQQKKINFALVGCGRVSKKHLEAISRIKNARLYAVCDIDFERMSSSAKQFSAIKTFSKYFELVKDKNIDVINICTPSGLHAQMAVLAARFKKHVILEKPMAMNVRDAKRILHAFSKSKTSLSVMLQNRFNPPIVFGKKKMPTLGKLLYINAQTYWYRKQEYYNDSWHGRKLMDGGVLMNQATHYVDMIQYLSEKKIKTVSAFGGTFGHKMECEDVISVNLKFEDGTIGNIQANTISFPENFEGAVTLFFEKATFRIGGKAMNKIEYWKGRGEKEVSNRIETSFDHIYGNSHFTIIKNMVEHLTKGKKLLISGEQGLLSLRVIEAAYKSLSSNKEVTI